MQDHKKICLCSSSSYFYKYTSAVFFCFRISVFFFYLVAKFKKQMIINNFLLSKEDRKVENHSVNLDWNILYSKQACHS